MSVGGLHDVNIVHNIDLNKMNYNANIFWEKTTTMSFPQYVADLLRIGIDIKSSLNFQYIVTFNSYVRGVKNMAVNH